MRAISPLLCSSIHTCPVLSVLLFLAVSVAFSHSLPFTLASTHRVQLALTPLRYSPLLTRRTYTLRGCIMQYMTTTTGT